MRSVAEDAATAVVWPAITFKAAPVRAPIFSGASAGNASRSAESDPAGASYTEGGDDWADAQSAMATAVANPPGIGGAGDDDSGPPPEELEAQMRAEMAAREGRADVATPKPPRARATDPADADKAPAVLPSLDSLVARIPDDVKATLDGLFRIRFQSVRQVPRKALAPATGKPSAL